MSVHQYLQSANGGTPTPAEYVNSTQSLILVVGGHEHLISASSFLNEEYLAELGRSLAPLDQPIEFILQDSLAWCPEARASVLTFLLGLAVPHIVRATRQATGGTVFDAVVELIPDAVDIDQCKDAIDAAIHVAGIVHPDAVPLAAERIAARLRERGIRGYTVAALAKSISQVVVGQDRLRGAAEELYLTVRDIFPDAPVGDTIVVPAGWEMSAAGIRRLNDKSEATAIPAALLIVGRSKNIRTSVEYVELAWHRAEEWQTRVVPRGLIATARTITGLAEFGVPITSNNASTAVQYFSDFERDNYQKLPLAEVTDQLGWHGEGSSPRFLLGNCDICSPRTNSDNLQVRSLRFLGADDGDNQMVEGYHTAGSFAGWQAAVARLHPYPVMVLTCYVSLTAPALRVFDSQNFVFSLAGPTSSGKTTGMRIAASFWGRPNERHPASVIGTWDSTLVYLECGMAVRCDTPFIVDDTKLAKRPQEVTQVIYDAVSGRGKGRGSVAGTRNTRTWRTVLMTGGESPIASFSESGGTRARVLEYWGSPFGDGRVETAALINDVSEVFSRNYGHAGLKFIEHLLQQHARWGEFRQQYFELRHEYQTRAGNNGVALRMADHFAAINMTAIIAHEADIFPWPFRDVVSELWPVLTNDSHEADRAAVALRHVISWANSHREEFAKSGRLHQPAPHTGWAGRWDDQGDFIGFLPHRLDEVLRQGGFEPDAIRRMWRDRNWLRLTPEKAYYRSRLISGGDVVSLVAVTREAITHVSGADSDGDEPPAIVNGPRPVRAGCSRPEHSGNVMGTP